MFNKTGILKRSTEPGKEKEKYLLVFVVAFFGMMIAFLPSLIINKGIFLYYGDFNSQQEMFYYHANEMVSNGNFGWDWGTDLGSSFIGSYSFYLLGSPFFWLSAIFPADWAAYLIPWLLALKTAVAALTSYAYIRRFVKSTNAAFIGALLYAFSGFQAYNVFFNHFHDVTAFFPLLLLALEMRVQDNRRGVFAVAVAICAATSYFFFVGEVVFVLIYFFIRCFDKNFNITMRKFIGIAIESVLGVGIAAIIFIPACLDTINNPRVDNRLYGLDLVVYNDKLRILRIIQSFFMMPDMPARSNILSADTAKWSSIAGYMPLFSMCGVIAFIKNKKKHWASRLIIICTIMAFVPFLNSIFVMFNSSYYARWFYMPILVMAMVTAYTIDTNRESLKKSFIPVAIITVIFAGIGMLPTNSNGVVSYGNLPKYKDLYYIQVGVAVVMLVAMGILVFKLIKHKNFYRIVSVMTAVSVIAVMCTSVWYCVSQGPDNQDYIDRAINGGDNIDLSAFDETDSENTFYRIDTSANVDNWCMFWGLSSMRCFQSVVPASLMNFYTEIGQTRDVASRIEPKYYPLRSLFSVKYYFNQQSDDDRKNGTSSANATLSSMPGFNYVATQNGFDIYQNENYIPMGFTYDYYTTDAVIEKASDEQKTHILLNAVVLDTDQIFKYGYLLEEYKLDSSTLTTENYAETCKQKQAESCYYFNESSDGFDAKIELDKDKLVFFSVPYDEGWSAQVNGEDAEIIQASYGFMAVVCPEGDNSITFTYETQGLKAGTAVTICSIAALIVYLGVFWYKGKKDPAEKAVTTNDIDY